MGQRNVRVVIGQGDPDRQGFLRTVLEDDGFDVVGEASTTSPLARLLTDEHPDVVVLDDAIGVSAVEVAAEMAPSAKIVVVWPAAVMPIAGAIRVEPSDVLQELGATVAVAAGIAPGVERPEWIERVRKDPSTLRELLAARGSMPSRPSVTELQRRGHRLHPSPGSPRRTPRAKPKAAAPGEEERRGVVTPLPLGAAAAAAASRGSEESWNRRLGIIALGGAAVAGALMIALAFNNRGPAIEAAGPSVVPSVQPSISSPPPTTGGGQDGGGQKGGQQPAGTDGANQGGSDGGSGTTTTNTGSNVRGEIGGSITPTGGGGGSTSGGGGGGGTPQSNPGGPHVNDHLPGSHDNAGSNGGSSSSEAPGNSGSHNPHGGPPGWSRRSDHTGRTSNAGGNSAHSNGRAYGHAHKQ